jgi:carbamoyltransferase
LFTTDERGGFRLRQPIRFDWTALMAARAWVAAETGLATREKSDPLTELHTDVAASLQRIFEEEVLKMARFVRDETGLEHLLFCGGCAQNCVAAGKLRASGLFAKVFNSPVGGDMASGLGAALLLERARRPGRPFRAAVRGFYLGTEPGAVPDAALPWEQPCPDGIHAAVGRELAAGKIVAVVRGGMELGARALGARSILADPRPPGMQSRLNLAVKFRESFRPFAPAVLAERAGEWFDCAEESDYMNYTAHLRPELRRTPPADAATLRERLDFPRCTIPSVIHVDFSARLQTVRPEVHPDLHRFISAFAALTGIPLLINTSFNVAGQPIVRTATEGWDCFVNTDIDLLVLGDRLFRNPQQKSRADKIAWLAQFAKSA